MTNPSNLLSPDILVKIKNKAQSIEDNTTMSYRRKIAELSNLISTLKPFCSRTNASVLSLDCKIAAWFSATAIYILISDLPETETHAATKCLDQALKSMDYASALVQEATKENIMINYDFIKSCNALALADIDETKKLISDLLSDDPPMFRVF